MCILHTTYSHICPFALFMCMRVFIPTATTRTQPKLQPHTSYEALMQQNCVFDLISKKRKIFSNSSRPFFNSSIYKRTNSRRKYYKNWRQTVLPSEECILTDVYQSVMRVNAFNIHMRVSFALQKTTNIFLFTNYLTI